MRTILSIAAAGMTAVFATAAPIAYNFDDTAAGGSAGSGSFTIDIGAGLGTYDATGVSGGPGTFLESWTGVHFSAIEGDLPSLVFDDTIPGNFSLSVAAVGGGAILPGSSAIDEWNNFLSQANAFGFSITPVTAAVPDGGSSFALLGVTVAALAGVESLRPRKNREVVAGGGIEPPTQGFSVLCSTD